jgi:hypothetical protein
MLGRWEATEAWCAAAKLGVIRALAGRRMPPGAGFSSADAEGLVQEVSCQLGVPVRAAGALIGLAEELDTRLVLTREALEAGVISLAKARIIAEATAVLDDDRAAAAETLIAGDLAGKTPGQVAAMIGRAVVTVDPEGARKRRERAQREDARVRFWREHAGTAALAGFGLPPDEALAANRHIQDRALAYRAAGMAWTLDQLRVRAFLDALNGTSSLPAPGTAPPRTTPPRQARTAAAGRAGTAAARRTTARTKTAAGRTAAGTARAAGTGTAGPAGTGTARAAGPAPGTGRGWRRRRC